MHLNGCNMFMRLRLPVAAYVYVFLQNCGYKIHVNETVSSQINYQEINKSLKLFCQRWRRFRKTGCVDTKCFSSAARYLPTPEKYHHSFCVASIQSNTLLQTSLLQCTTSASTGLLDALHLCTNVYRVQTQTILQIEIETFQPICNLQVLQKKVQIRINDERTSYSISMHDMSVFRFVSINVIQCNRRQRKKKKKNTNKHVKCNALDFKFNYTVFALSQRKMYVRGSKMTLHEIH